MTFSKKKAKQPNRYRGAALPTDLVGGNPEKYKLWLSGHMGGRREGPPKESYSSLSAAKRMADGMCEEFPQYLYRHYECHWTDRFEAGRVGEPHWHVGRYLHGGKVQEII